MRCFLYRKKKVYLLPIKGQKHFLPRHSDASRKQEALKQIIKTYKNRRQNSLLTIETKSNKFRTSRKGENSSTKSIEKLSTLRLPQIKSTCGRVNNMSQSNLSVASCDRTPFRLPNAWDSISPTSNAKSLKHKKCKNPSIYNFLL